MAYPLINELKFYRYIYFWCKYIWYIYDFITNNYVKLNKLIGDRINELSLYEILF